MTGTLWDFASLDYKIHQIRNKSVSTSLNISPNHRPTISYLTPIFGLVPIDCRSSYCWVTEVGTAAMIQVRPSSSESSTVFRSVEITFSGVLRFLEMNLITVSKIVMSNYLNI